LFDKSSSLNGIEEVSKSVIIGELLDKSSSLKGSEEVSKSVTTGELFKDYLL